MPIVVSSPKGGSGATVVAAALALVAPNGLLVDLAGDALAAFGRPGEPTPDPRFEVIADLAADAGTRLDPKLGVGVGVGDWLASSAPSSRLDELVVAGKPSILPSGATPDRGGTRPGPTGERWAALGAWCRRRSLQSGDTVVVDAGVVPVPSGIATTNLLVTRACYLALRRAGSAASRPDAVVVVREPGRALTTRDIERSVGSPVVAEIAFDPAVARAVDAGLDHVALSAALRRAATRVLRECADLGREAHAA